MTAAAPASAPALDRRRLGRELTRAGRASVAECLAESAAVPDSDALRIGFTGPPGAGKSTLIARLARTRLARPGRIGVLAVDPSSPISHGSILGDRVRMDEIAGHPRLYIRSVPSRNAHDGLADNIAEMLAVMERHGFDDLILETVGVGQADYTVRSLVDTVVLVVTPESGDAIQAMKAGIQEMADIYVVNKADRPGAQRTLADIRAVLQSRDPGPADWRPPVVAASIEEIGRASCRERV